MAPRLPKLSKISQQIGDNRIESILHAVFAREKRACKSDHKNYGEMIEEVQSRIDHRHGIILELKKLERNSVVDECLAGLKAAEHEDFAEVSWLLQRIYAAALRAGFSIDASNVLQSSPMISSAPGVKNVIMTVSEPLVTCLLEMQWARELCSYRRYSRS